MAFARRRLRTQLEQRGAPPAERERADEVLDPKALTIGFARRFATYKRATLLFRDPERLARILSNPERPVQIIYAGKAHPADQEGKDFIRQVVHYARRPEFRQRIVFLEAYDGANGWAVGRGEEYEDAGYHDQVESHAIYQMLESEVVPMFYTRGRDGLPREWVRRMKNAMRTVCPVFSAYRMVKEYTERLYLPAERWWATLGAKGLERARALATWKARVRSGWREVAVLSVKADGVAPLEAGATRPVQAEVALGSLRSEDVSVVLYSGPLSGEGEILSASVSDMKVEGTPRVGAYLYSGTLQGKTTGLHGFRVRILPAHEDLFSPLAMNCIVWG